MYYEIYVNKTGTDTPGSFKGIVDVIDDETGILINKWCEKTFGQKYKVWKGDLKEVWRCMPIDDIQDEKIIMTIKKQG